jgi:glutamyl-tRNA synthetase
MAGLKTRAKTLVELAEISRFYVLPRPLALDDKAGKLLQGSRDMLAPLAEAVASADWAPAALEADL